MLSRKATNTNLIVFGLTQPGLEPMIYHTRGEHANHYTTDAVHLLDMFNSKTCVIVKHVSYHVLDMFNSKICVISCTKHVSCHVLDMCNSKTCVIS
jgi:hypothetical protein